MHSPVKLLEHNVVPVLNRCRVVHLGLTLPHAVLDPLQKVRPALLEEFVGHVVGRQFRHRHVLLKVGEHVLDELEHLPQMVLARFPLGERLGQFERAVVRAHQRVEGFALEDDGLAVR